MTRHPQVSDFDLAEYILARFGGLLDVSGPFTISGERRFVAYNSDGGRVVVNAYLVGPTNAGKYRHWLAMPKPAWGRIKGEKPAGWGHYALMIGLLPDGKSIWWSVLYDEKKIDQSGLEPEYIRSGYGRLASSLVKFAIVGQAVDEVQPGLWDDIPPDPPCDHLGYPIESMASAGFPGKWACSRCGHPFVPEEVSA